MASPYLKVKNIQDRSKPQQTNYAISDMKIQVNVSQRMKMKYIERQKKKINIRDAQWNVRMSSFQSPPSSPAHF